MAAMDAQAQWEFIERVGAENGANEEARRKWRERGVPTKYWLAITDAATAAGIALDRQLLVSPPNIRRRARAADRLASAAAS